MTVYVNEIQVKLNKFQYSSYSEYEEDLKSIFDKYLQDGPKYHGYQKVLQDIHMKLLTQGSKKIFRDVEKKYNVEISKCNEKFNNTQEELRETKKKLEKIEKEKNLLDQSSDETITKLKYKIENLSSQIELIQKTKEEDEERLQRQNGLKIQEQQSYQRSIETKYKETLEKIEEQRRKVSELEHGWGK